MSPVTGGMPGGMSRLDVVFLLAGVGALLAAALPRAAEGRPFSLPLVFLLGGAVVYGLPLGLPAPDPVASRGLLEHLAEVVVIIALMGAGLALDRPVGRRSWSSTWRLLAVGMPVTVLLVAGAARVGLGWPVAAALLLGAVLAPTDPVLASDVQVGEPTDDPHGEDEVRFALTSEAGLNDGLAFPVVHLAVAAALSAGVAGSGLSWVAAWAVRDVGYRVGAGVLTGLAVGWLTGWLFFRVRAGGRRLAEHADGFVALAVTFLAYGVAEALRGYGFVAVFVAACCIRAVERDHGYHRVLHGFVEQVERLLTAVLLFLLGGALVTGVLDSLDARGVAVGLFLLLVARPVAGLLALWGSRAGGRERLAIAFFGIRGIGSGYYLAFATGAASFGVPDRELWSVVAFVVAVSVLLHGVSAAPLMNRLDRIRRARTARRGVPEPSDTDLAGEHP